MHLLGVPIAESLGASRGQGWMQIGELALAFALSAAIGLEREWRQKSAGLRTHTLVGVGAALFVLVSKYGFADLGGIDNLAFDPSRVAAQVVSGIGFIGGGLIFVRGDIVRGLTTAAIVWVTAAIGMACGAGLWLLALVVTAGHFAIVLGFTAVSERLPRSRFSPVVLLVVYADKRGLLREALAECTRRGFAVAKVSTEHGFTNRPGTVAVRLELHGSGSTNDLVAALLGYEGVEDVEATDILDEGE